MPNIGPMELILILVDRADRPRPEEAARGGALGRQGHARVQGALSGDSDHDRDRDRDFDRDEDERPALKTE